MSLQTGRSPKVRRISIAVSRLSDTLGRIEKVGEVVLLGETGELRPVVEPHIDDTLCARLTE